MYFRFKYSSNRLPPWLTRSSAAMTGTAVASKRTPLLPLGTCFVVVVSSSSFRHPLGNQPQRLKPPVSGLTSPTPLSYNYLVYWRHTHGHGPHVGELSGWALGMVIKSRFVAFYYIALNTKLYTHTQISIRVYVLEKKER
jgi:hypothetical protein